MTMKQLNVVDDICLVFACIIGALMLGACLFALGYSIWLEVHSEYWENVKIIDTKWVKEHKETRHSMGVVLVGKVPVSQPRTYTETVPAHYKVSCFYEGENIDLAYYGEDVPTGIINIPKLKLQENGEYGYFEEYEEVSE